MTCDAFLLLLLSLSASLIIKAHVGMFVSVTHQSLVDPQVRLSMSAGCGYHYLFAPFQPASATLRAQHDTSCRLDFDQKAIEHDTRAGRGITCTTTCKHEQSSDKIVFISFSLAFFPLV